MHIVAEAGFIKIESELGRHVVAHVTPAAYALKKRMEPEYRKDRIHEARQRLGKVPDVTPRELAELYDITFNELVTETVPPC
jgi:hypothetical protein